MGPANSEESSIKSQASFLASYMNFMTAEEDLSFKESSVKDVTDGGREDAIEALMKAISTAVKRVTANPTASIKDGATLPIADPTQEVLELVTKLRAVRHAKHDLKDPAASVGILRKLESLPIDVECLKRTKVALEFNNDFWKHHEDSTTRERVASLVRRWKGMYRAVQGKGTSLSEQRLKVLATDLEAAIMYHFRRDRGDEKVTKNWYARKHDLNHFQTQSGHRSLTQEVICLLEREPRHAVGHLEGSEKAVDIVTKAGKNLQLRDTLRGAKRSHAQIS
eukprot:gnl/MRDRNA2_/MRDRNA2_136800_c0_seq1.p1 gnl/MRDRNA2_/MRDRNA2_136800_c0~~gnl/MRDRNA2_/MRDRNA2_136800_c0_seq1.p1  ORF type:complete len:302 (+),score=65.63 gnl/MRDRNA2_/MRDRNA2_136800_c0_seq1:68-907(+)